MYARGRSPRAGRPRRRPGFFPRLGNISSARSRARPQRQRYLPNLRSIRRHGVQGSPLPPSAASYRAAARPAGGCQHASGLWLKPGKVFRPRSWRPLQSALHHRPLKVLQGREVPKQKRAAYPRLPGEIQGAGTQESPSCQGLLCGNQDGLASIAAGEMLQDPCLDWPSSVPEPML